MCWLLRMKKSSWNSWGLDIKPTLTPSNRKEALFILSISPPIFNYDNHCCLSGRLKYHCTVAYHRQNTLHLIMKMKYFVTCVPTWTRVSQKPMDCMIKVNQKHLLPLIPLVVGERKKRVSWHSLIFLCRNESPAFWCCHIHENRVSLPLLRVVIYGYPLLTPNFAKDID